MTTEFPGNPTSGQIARAEQCFAAIREAVDHMLALDPPNTVSETAAAVQLSGGPIAQAVLHVDSLVGNGDLTSAAFALGGELLRRLHEARS